MAGGMYCNVCKSVYACDGFPAKCQCQAAAGRNATGLDALVGKAVSCILPGGLETVGVLNGVWADWLTLTLPDGRLACLRASDVWRVEQHDAGYQCPACKGNGCAGCGETGRVPPAKGA